ncbi:MAG: S41 family peptidase [Tenacibaculum sp.]
MSFNKKITLITILYFYCLNISFSQKNNVTFCDELTSLNEAIQLKHFSPKKTNDQFSKEVFSLFLNSLDEKKEIFTKENISQLEIHKKKLDDYISLKQCSFINDFYSHYIKSIKNRIQFLSEIKTSDLILNQKNKHTDFKEFKTSKSSLNNYWLYKINRKILIKAISNDSILSKVKRRLKKEKSTYFKEIVNKELCKLNSLLSKANNDTFIKELFFNAILKYQDPNSAYFSVSEKNSYVNMLSVNTYSFGFNTIKQDGNIIVASIISGSAAFKNGNIHKNDIIQLITANNKRLKTDCINNQDVINFLNQEKNSTITLHLKKKNGTIKKVSLTKELLKTSNNKVRAYVIDKKVGYIRIDNFYSSNTLGVANDVSKEIFKLKREQIEGLIIDLRYNGGGSMKEASELSGMFINKGPLAIIKERNQENQTIRDYNRGTLFNKPIVVLINHFSASAAEFFASLMQDYKRAIIVGNTSFGKATSQTITPLKNGFIKITVGKFYRVTGKSIQAKGVTPNVILPSFYDNHKVKEKDQLFSLKPDTVTVKLKHKAYSKSLNNQSIIDNSNLRIASSKTFQNLKQQNAFFLKHYINSPKKHSLKTDSLFMEYNRFKQFWNRYDKAVLNKKKLVISNTNATEDYLIFNEDEKETNTIILNDIASDLYINEAYTIIKDQINLNTSK